MIVTSRSNQRNIFIHVDEAIEFKNVQRKCTRSMHVFIIVIVLFERQEIFPSASRTAPRLQHPLLISRMDQAESSFSAESSIFARRFYYRVIAERAHNCSRLASSSASFLPSFFFPASHDALLRPLSGRFIRQHPCLGVALAVRSCDM